MDHNWLDFTQRNAGNATSSFLNLQYIDCITPINQLGIIEVTGADKNSFLQGQITCDINKITKEQASKGGLCDVKGRLQANFICLSYSDSLLLILPENMLGLAIKRLKKYAMFSKVSIEDTTKQWFCLVYQFAQKKIQKMPFTVTQENKIIEIRFPGPPFYSLLLSRNEKMMLRLVESKHATTKIVSENLWRYNNIKTKLAYIYPETSGLFTPQMIELEKHHGVSFNKGCYLGQEIVARTQHLGKLKRHLQQFQFTTIDNINSGEPITDVTGNIIGTLIDAISEDNSNMLALGVIEDRAIEGELFIKRKKVKMVENLK